MNYKLKVLKEDDERFKCAKDDIVLIDADYDWDGDKVEGIFNITKRAPLNNSFYKYQLRAYKASEFE